MSPCRRTFCFVLIFLSLNNDLVFVAGVPVGPVLTEYYPSPGAPPQLINSVLTVAPANRAFPEQNVFPTQRFNEVFSFGSPQGISINTVATSNYGVPRPNSLTTYSTYLSPAELSNTLPIAAPITEALAYPSDIDSLTIIENYPSVTQTIQVEGYAPTANVADIYQTPITVQIPSLPQPSPFIPVPPQPEILLSQNIIQEIYTTNVVPEPYPQIVETEIATVTSVPPVETATLNIPSCDLGCGQQLPVTLQINMATPWVPEPVIAVLSQPTPTPTSYQSFDYPCLPAPVPPVIVMEKSKSKLKSILPILMLTLFDGGCGNRGGGGSCSCSQCSPSTPIPFPIVIPTSSPIITRSRCKGKSKTTSGTDAEKSKKGT